MRPYGNRKLSAVDQYRRAVRRRRWGKVLPFVVIVLGILLLAGVVVNLVPRLPGRTSNTPGPGPISINSDASIITAPDGEIIGISDGKQLWEDATTLGTSDAEALIYQENQRVLSSNHRSITVVVGTILTGKFASSGRDNLQGAYVAQKEYNDQCIKLSSCLPARFLIANAGSGSTASDEVAYANVVAEQIVQAQQLDKSIVGVMGWPASSDLVYGNTIFAAAHIPLVSPTALLSASSSSPYIFSVAPSNIRQGIVGAYYAEHTLNARRAAVFVDPVDRYSQTLADAFSQRFTTDGNSIVVTKNYHIGVSESIQAELQDVLNQKPDLIYLAGHSTDVNLLLNNLPDCQTSFCPQVLGGDGLYELGGYATIASSLLARLHFTSFAYPDEWDILASSTQKPDFFSEYPQAFNPQQIRSNDGRYGFGRADSDVILSYDAMITLLKAAGTTFNDQETTFSPDDLQKALTQFTGSQGRQGVSGEISFGADGNPAQKVVVVLYFDTQAHIHEDKCFGFFLQSEVNNPSSSGCLQLPS